MHQQDEKFQFMENNGYQQVRGMQELVQQYREKISSMENEADGSTMQLRAEIMELPTQLLDTESNFTHQNANSVVRTL